MPKPPKVAAKPDSPPAPPPSALNAATAQKAFVHVVKKYDGTPPALAVLGAVPLEAARAFARGAVLAAAAVGIAPDPTALLEEIPLCTHEGLAGILYVLLLREADDAMDDEDDDEEPEGSEAEEAADDEEDDEDGGGEGEDDGGATAPAAAPADTAA